MRFVLNVVTFIVAFWVLGAALALFGWIGPWEMVLLAVLAALVTFAVDRIRARHRSHRARRPDASADRLA